MVGDMFLECMCGAAVEEYAVVRSMGWGMLILGVMAAGALYLFKCWKIRHWLIYHLKLIAAGLWVLGLIVYLIGFSCPDEPFRLGISTGLRAALSSMEMFVSHSDLIEVNGHWHHEPLYMFFFAAVHFLAVLVSAVFVIRLLGNRMQSWLKMAWDGRFGCMCRCRKRKLYIFFESNEASMLLAQNIVEEHEKRSLRGDRGWNSYRIVFVGMPSDDTHSSRFTFSHFFSSRSHGNDHLDRIERWNAVTAYADRELDSAAMDGKIFRSLGLDNLERMVDRADDVRIFLLSDDESVNVRRTVVLKSCLSARCGGSKAAPASGGAGGSPRPGYTLYCHARRESAHNLLEIQDVSDRVEIRVLDSSYLSVEQLKMNVAYQPVSFVEVGADASVESEFNALIVGFGETGEDALRFLYEFGAFANRNGERSPFRCTVMDPDMERLRARFYARNPALADNPAVQLLDTDCRTDRFWNWMKEAVATLNYVVVALGDDEAGMTLAVDICDFAIRYADKRENFKIFVRSYRSEKADYMEHAAAFYDSREIGRPIVVFGRMADMYTYDLIVGDRLSAEAEWFYDKYNQVSPEKEKKSWSDRRKDALRQNTLAALRGLRRKEGQDLANALHRRTKMHMIKQVLQNGNSPLCGTELSDWLRSLQARKEVDAGAAYPRVCPASGAPDYDIGPVMLRLAQCEHLRWMAALELMGYVMTPEKTNELTLEHACLVSWNELDRVALRLKWNFKASDFSVVETTIELDDEERKNDR